MENLPNPYHCGPLKIYEEKLGHLANKKSYIIQIKNKRPHRINESFLRHLIQLNEDDEISTELNIHNKYLYEDLSEYKIPVKDLRAGLILTFREIEREKQRLKETQPTQERNYSNK